MLRPTETMRMLQAGIPLPQRINFGLVDDQYSILIRDVSSVNHHSQSGGNRLNFTIFIPFGFFLLDSIVKFGTKVNKWINIYRFSWSGSISILRRTIA